MEIKCFVHQTPHGVKILVNDWLMHTDAEIISISYAANDDYWSAFVLFRLRLKGKV